MQLRTAFLLALDAQELSELVKVFDRSGKGFIDGCEFLVSFTKMGYLAKVCDSSVCIA
jgi:hypothetical protein